MRSLSRFTSLLIVLALVVAACGDDASVLSDGETTVTTESPSVTPEAPSETTEAPPATTEAPPSTTEAPPETTEAPPESTLPPPPPPASVPVVTPVDASKSNDDPPLTMDVTVPVVSGVAPSAVDAMNGEIGPAVLGTADSFWDEIVNGEPPPDDFGTSSELGLGYEATAVTAEILSLRFDLYTYYQGAAHGTSGIYTMNFASQTGQLLALSDILVPGTFPVVASMVEQVLIDQLYGGDAGEAGGWLPAFDEFVLDGWVVTVDGLAFSFDQYEVGFGAMGSPTVVIPWADLAAVIDPDGLAAGFAFGP